MSGRSIDELADTIRARLDAEQEAAGWTQAGPWWVEQEKVKHWGHEPEAPRLASSKGWLAVFTSENGWLNGVHVALHDPTTVLRRVARDRDMLARFLAEPHEQHPTNPWFSCRAVVTLVDGRRAHRTDDAQEPVGLCGCGRDGRVRGYLELMAGADETEAAG